MLRLGTLTLALMTTSIAFGGDATAEKSRKDSQQNQSYAEHHTHKEKYTANKPKMYPQETVRASELMNKTVINSKGESLGAIEDVVLDPMNGKVKYAAVSMGGFLGIGDKLFAVPWKQFECSKQDGEHVLKLPNVTKENFENVKGFDQDDWPNMADKNWQRQNDAQYDEEDDNDQE